MIRSGRIKYFSQLTSFPWEMVAKTSCGISSAAMAISYRYPDIKPIDVLKKASELHLVPKDKENYWLEISINSERVYVPIGQTISNRLKEKAGDTNLKIVSGISKENEYKPVFSLNGGYDHRGSTRLFGSFGIRAEKVGDKNKPLELDELKEVVGVGDVFMVSAINRKDPWKDFSDDKDSSHVMLITSIERIGGDDYYYVYDPYSETGEMKVRLIHCEDFGDLGFTGYGTAIKYF